MNESFPGSGEFRPNVNKVPCGASSKTSREYVGEDAVDGRPIYKGDVGERGAVHVGAQRNTGNTEGGPSSYYGVGWNAAGPQTTTLPVTTVRSFLAEFGRHYIGNRTKAQVLATLVTLSDANYEAFEEIVDVVIGLNAFGIK